MEAKGLERAYQERTKDFFALRERYNTTIENILEYINKRAKQNEKWADDEIKLGLTRIKSMNWWEYHSKVTFY